MNNTPRVYIACLAGSDASTLHGEWINLDGEEDVLVQLYDVLDSSPFEDATEWVVLDHEHCGDFGENPSLTDLRALSEACQCDETERYTLKRDDSAFFY